MQVTKGTWRMCKQCVPGSLSSSPQQEPGNEAMPNSDSGCEAALPKGKVEKFCTFTMAWKCCRSISEVNSTNLGTLLDHLCFYHLFFFIRNAFTLSC